MPAQDIQLDHLQSLENAENPFLETEENVIPTSENDRDQFQQAKDSLKRGKPLYKRKAFIIVTSAAITCLLSLLFLLFLLKDNSTLHKHKGVASTLDNKEFAAVVPPGQTTNSSSEWRLDTANNYTSNLQFWRNDFGTSKERHYYFNITTLLKTDINGAIRNLTVINGQFPGPLVEANSGDTIFLHVQNQMDDEPVSFHLHGLFYPNNTFDDGASSINVCPIPAGGNYTYRIPTGEKEYGTYWYHSHWSTQYADGVYGPVILHSPIEDSNLTYYDADRIYVVNDYYYEDAADLLDTYMIPDNENSEPTPDAGLISGTYSQANYFTPADGKSTYKTATYFDPNSIYRVRIANVGFFLPFKFSIDQHKLTIVETDGTLLEPLESDYVDVAVGQRYSFFMNRTSTDTDAYWIHARFNQFCLANDNPNFATDVMAIVSYNNVYQVPTTKETWQYDGGSPKCLGFPEDQLRTLNGQVPLNKNGSNRADYYVELDVSFNEGANQMTFAYFNDYSWRGLSNSSSMHELIFNNVFRTNSHVENTPTFTENQYILNFDKRGMIVDLLINNFDDGSHPFHLHGYKFWVLANANKGSFYPDFYESHSDRLDLTNPSLRDTVNVAPFGFAVLRFVVDNPGVFPFHCHIGWHIEAGLMLQVNALQSEWMKQDYNPAWAEMCGYDFSDPHVTALIGS